MSKFCGKCGALVGEDKKFCSKCGNNLAGISTETIQQNRIDNYIIEKEDNLAVQNNYQSNETTKRSPLTCVLSIFLCVLFFIFSMSAIFVGVARLYSNEDNLKDIISNVDLNEISINSHGEQTNIANLLFDNMKDEFINDYNMTTEKIENIFSNNVIDKQIKSYLVDYVENVVNGEKSKKLTTDGIIKIFKNVSPEIYKEIGYQFTDKDYEDIRNQINDGNMEFLITSGIEDFIGFDPNIIQIALSITTLIILIIISLALLILILKVNSWRFKYFFKDIGITVIIAGILLICGSLTGLIISMITEIYLLGVLLSSLSIKVLIFGLSALIIGIGMFVLYKLKSRSEQI